MPSIASHIEGYRVPRNAEMYKTGCVVENNGVFGKTNELGAGDTVRSVEEFKSGLLRVQHFLFQFSCDPRPVEALWLVLSGAQVS